jgi:hypothetical protein
MDPLNITIDTDLLEAALEFFREPATVQGALSKDGPLLQTAENGMGQVIVPHRRKPTPRKGHTKSRLGCSSCKRRKIKCQETKPSCGHCVKGGIKCEYPTLSYESSISRVPLTVIATSPIMQPQSTPVVFSMKDMQFFHHFLVRAYPHLPVGADKTWTMQIPAYAQEVCTPKLNIYNTNNPSTSTSFMQCSGSVPLI